MATSCNGICYKYKGKFRYKDGSKYCSTCDRFVVVGGLYCPCCHFRVRLGRRARFGKHRKEGELTTMKESP